MSLITNITSDNTSRHLSLAAAHVVKNTVKNTTKPEKVGITVKLSSLVRYMTHSAQGIFGSNRSARPLDSFKLFHVAIAPLMIANIFRTIFSLGGTSSNEKIDGALSIVSDVGGVGDAVGTIAEGLASVGLVAIQTAGWLTPLFVVSAGLQAFGIVLATKNLVETHRFSKGFSKASALEKPVAEYSIEDYRSGLDLIESKRTKERGFIGKHFDVNEDRLADRLVAIEMKAKAALSSSNESDIKESKEEMHTTMQKLGQRMKTKNWSRALTILSAAVSLIGFGVLFTPLAPLGFALLGTGIAMFLGNFAAMKVSTHRFESELKIKETP